MDGRVHGSLCTSKTRVWEQTLQPVNGAEETNELLSAHNAAGSENVALTHGDRKNSLKDDTSRAKNDLCSAVINMGYTKEKVYMAYENLDASKTINDLLNVLEGEYCNDNSDCENKKTVEDNAYSMTGDVSLCICCMERPKNIVFQPCNHLLCCEECSARIKSKCPTCNGKIRKILKIYV